MPGKTIILYRGYATRPKMLIPNLEEELKQRRRRLKEIQDKYGENAVEGDVVAIARRVELEQIAGKQFFTDDQQIARQKAGENGFVITLEVPLAVAQDHMSPRQEIMHQGGEMRIVTNFVFSGRELMHHPDWSMDLIELNAERPGRGPEGKG